MSRGLSREHWNPAGAFFMPKGGEADAKETEEAVFLPRMPEADGGEVL